jgi:Rho-binding antiterminator
MFERPDTEYRPVDCSLHDHYEAWAVRRTLLTVEWISEDGSPRHTDARISDIRVRDGAEYLVLSSGDVIRLDRLERVAPREEFPAE